MTLAQNIAHWMFFEGSRQTNEGNWVFYEDEVEAEFGVKLSQDLRDRIVAELLKSHYVLEVDEYDENKNVCIDITFSSLFTED